MCAMDQSSLWLVFCRWLYSSAPASSLSMLDSNRAAAGQLPPINNSARRHSMRSPVPAAFSLFPQSIHRSLDAHWFFGSSIAGCFASSIAIFRNECPLTKKNSWKNGTSWCCFLSVLQIVFPLLPLLNHFYSTTLNLYASYWFGWHQFGLPFLSIHLIISVPQTHPKN